MNGVRITSPIKVTTITPTNPVYAYVNILGGSNTGNSISGPLSIQFYSTVIGPTGIGATGPMQNILMNYVIPDGVRVDSSTGNFMINMPNGGAIYSTTPITKPFILTFTVITPFSGVGYGGNGGMKMGITNMTSGIGKVQYSGTITNGLDSNEGVALSYGVYGNLYGTQVGGPFNYSAMNNCIMAKDYITGSWPFIGNNPNVPNAMLTGNIGSSFQFVYDGSKLSMFSNGTPVANTPIVPTVPLPWYIIMGGGGIAGTMNITYVEPHVYPTGPTGPSLRTISRIYSGATTNSLTPYIGAVLQYPTGGTIMSVFAPSYPIWSAGSVYNGLARQGLTLEASLSSTSSYLTCVPTTIGNPVSTSQVFINNNSFPLSININGATNMSRPSVNQIPPNMYFMYVKVSSGINSRAQDITNFTYTFFLQPTASFVIYMGSQSSTVYDMCIYQVTITETPAAAGGGPTKAPRIVDVAPSLKPKLRKSSIRVKKAKKQTKKGSHK